LPTSRLVDPMGVVHDVPADAVPSALQQGWTPQSDEQRVADVAAAARSADYGGIGNRIEAGAAGVLRGATLGLSDVALRGLGGDQAAEYFGGIRRENPGTSLAGELAGAAITAGIGGGGGAGAALAGEAGAAAASRGALSTIARAGARGAAEGALYGAGTGVSELALDPDPLTWEHATSVLSSNALYGAATGGVLGAGGKAAEIGLLKAKRAIDDVLARGVAETERLAADPDAAIATMNARQLEEARKVELKRVFEERAPEREDLIANLKDARATMREAEPWKVSNGSPLSTLRESGAVSRKADVAVRNLLDKRARLLNDPRPLINALEDQRTAYEDLLEGALRERNLFEKEFKDAPRRIANDILDTSNKEWNVSTGFLVSKGKLKDELGPFTPAGLDQAVTREMLRRYGSLTNPQFPARFNLIPEVEATLERNKALAEELQRVLAEPKTPRLDRIADRLEELRAPKPVAEPGVGDVAKALVRAIPFTGPLEAATSLGGKAVEVFKKVTGKVKTRALEASSAFLGPAAKAASLTSAYGPVSATKFLEAVRYAPKDTVHVDRASDDDEPAPRPRSRGEDVRLARAYEDRTAEIRAMTAYDATGTPRLRFEARARMAAQLTAIRAVDPLGADRIETIATRRIEYLSSILPRRPEIGGAPLGPKDYHPSEMVMREFARAAAALEDPAGVLERAAHGIVVPEEVRAIAAVYPEMLHAWTTEVVAQFATLRRTLPVARRVSLSLLTGQPVDPSLEPTVMNTLQAQYQFEPQPERAQPQFGSVKDKTDIGTPSQRREEGTTST
jgi:hypothetical protein